MRHTLAGCLILCLTLPPPLFADTLKVQQAQQSLLQPELAAGLEEEELGSGMERHPVHLSGGLGQASSRKIELGFETGRLGPIDEGKSRRAKEGFLATVALLATSGASLALGLSFPLVALVGGSLAWLGWMAFRLSSAGSRALRLVGGNPVSLLYPGKPAVAFLDDLLDFHEDAHLRGSRPLFYGLHLFRKLLSMPFGLAGMALEFLVDCGMLRFSLPLFKLKEFLALRDYHSLVSPEKSNDLTYSALGYARYRKDPYTYQAIRLANFLIELNDYRTDLMIGSGIPETNLLLQDEITAYQTLRRLKIEEIEEALKEYSERFPDSPVAKVRTDVLQMHIVHRREFFDRSHRKNRILYTQTGQELHALLYSFYGYGLPRYFTWHILRILEFPGPFARPDLPDAITDEDLGGLVEARIVQEIRPQVFQLTPTFEWEVERLLQFNFDPASEAERRKILRSHLPTLLIFKGKAYLPRAQPKAEGIAPEALDWEVQKVEQMIQRNGPAFALFKLEHLARKLDLYDVPPDRIEVRVRQDSELAEFMIDLDRFLRFFRTDPPEQSNELLRRIVDKLWRTDAFIRWKETGQEGRPLFGHALQVLHSALYQPEPPPQQESIPITPALPGEATPSETKDPSTGGLEESIAILAQYAGVPLGDVSEEADEARAYGQMP